MPRVVTQPHLNSELNPRPVDSPVPNPLCPYAMRIIAGEGVQHGQRHLFCSDDTCGIYFIRSPVLQMWRDHMFYLNFFMFRTVVSETSLEIGEIVVDVCCIGDSLSSRS